MVSSRAQSLAVEPILTYPPAGETGKTYFMAVDLRSALVDEGWPDSVGEEYIVYCDVECWPLFRCEQLGEPTIVLHRFGGSYGPARFRLTASDEPQKGTIRITLSNGWGVPLTVIETPEIRIEPLLVVPSHWTGLSLPHGAGARAVNADPREGPAKETSSLSPSSPPPVVRQPAPIPPAWLLEEIMRGNVIPFIGQGLSMAAVPNMPSKDVLLRELASSLPINEQVRKTIEILLDLELENKSAEVLALLSRDSEIDLYRQLKAILNPLVDKYRPSSVPHRILDALNLRFYITTNYDRVLEQLLTYPYEVVTSSDTSALRYVMGDPNSRFILKLYGDISRPETILQSEHMLNEIRAKNGNNLSSEAQVLFDVLKQVFHNHTVLFLGSSLKDRSGLYGLVTLFASLWGPPRRRHMALVPQDLTRTRIREKIAEELGIQTLEYVPDAVHSQMWEFLLYLDNSKESEPIPGDTWSRFFRPQEHSAYLKLLLALEQRAREVRIVTPTLTNMISTYEYVDTVIKQEFLRKAQAEDLAVEERLVNENLVSLMRHRRDNLEARLYQDLVAVRVLFLQSEFDRSLNQAEDVRLRLIINRYQYMLRLIEETDLEVRLIPTLTTEEFRAIVTSTEIIIGTQPTPHGDISIAQAVQGTAAFFEALVIQTNTEEVNSNLVEFERLWGTAWSRKATLSYIRRALDHRLRMLG